MSTNTNSFRLQRLTKTVGLRDKSMTEYEPKETFKLAALNSINRGVKYNDLSYISGRDLNKLRKEPDSAGDIEYESAHANLSATRKNYDSVHKEKTKRDESISKIKEQKNKLSIIEGELVEKKQTGRKRVSDLEANLERIKNLHIETEMQKKVLLGMRDRLKTDKVVYDQRKFDMEKELRFLKKQKEVIIIDKTDLVESDDRVGKVHKKFLQQLRAEQAEREQHLANLENMILQKERMRGAGLLRSQEMKEIAERAMQDKDDDQIKWEKLYLSNKFVSKLLRDKMDREMEKFFTVESAFKTIKISTGVNDADTLVTKFLNKESAYGDLLGKIAENEQRITELKREREELVATEKELEAEKEILDTTKIEAVSIEQESKELQKIEERQKRVGLQRDNLRSWVARFVKKINSVLKKDYPVHSERDLKSVGESFIQYLKHVREELADIEQKEDEAKKESFTAGDELKGNKKVIRIKQNENVFEESDEEATAEDTAMIMDQRKEIHINNERFLKEARARYEEKKKAKAEAASPKKKPQPEKAKKVEAE